MILHLSLNEWRALAQLLEKGYSFSQCLQLMNYDDSKVLQLIQQGHSIETILFDGKTGKFYELLKFFSKITSIHSAIQSSLIMFDFEKNIRTKIIKQTAYPLFILFFSFVTIFMFSNYIIPQLLANFEADKSILFDFILTIRNGIILLVFCIVISLLLLFIIQIYKPFKIAFFQAIVSPLHVMNGIHSYYLSCYLAELFRLGLSTQQSFVFLLNLNQKKLFYFVVSQIRMQLELGEDLSTLIQESTFLSASFKLHYAIGSSTNQFLDALEDFRSFQEEKWFKKIKYFGLFIQLSSYTLVGILIICVYQIMLIPLQMLESM